MKRIITITLCVLSCIPLLLAQTHIVQQVVQSFPLSDVRLTAGPFENLMQQDRKWLLNLEPDRLLSGYRLESGLTPKATKYGGWEDGGLAGQTLGHYLSACAMMYASTGDKELITRIEYCINELDVCQQAMGNDLIAGMPRAKELFGEVARGDIRTAGFGLNEGWVPMYNLHKLFAGLLDVCKYTDNTQAYKVLIKLSDYFVSILSPLTDAQLQKILVSEHGGINESFAQVYALSNDKRYLDLALRLNHKQVLDPLSKGVDELVGKHANTQIPKVVGVIRQYELTGEQSLYNTANFFWNTVVHNHTYVIGGNSEAEHFGLPQHTSDRITDKTCETCNTYNMLKLTKHLFELSPTLNKADFYERALYNHILAAHNPKDGMVCYMSPLVAGARKMYSGPFDSFWCCVGTGLENPSKFGEFIYSKNKKNDLFVNLFIASQLNWKERKMVIHQQTNFPESNTTQLVLEITKSQKFSINFRLPSWAKQGYSLFVNGAEVEITKSAIEGYLAINRKWNNGDIISYTLPMPITSEEALGNASIRAYLHGPIVLASVLNDKQEIPQVIANDVLNAQQIVEVSQKEPYAFMMTKAEPKQIAMMPYYKTGANRTVVYFDHFTTQQWEEKKEDILKKKDMANYLKERTIDSFQPGEMQPERDHNLKGEKTEEGVMQRRKFRKAIDGGWFSFDMKVVPNAPIDLVCTYWGHFGDIHKFSIDIDGQPLTTIIIHWWGGSFIDKTYQIPTEFTKGKSSVNITLRAISSECIAGPLFDCKTLKR